MPFFDVPIAVHLPGSLAQLATLDAVAVIYGILIVVMALAAVFSSKPSRRKAALEVLRLLLPGRRRPPRNPRLPPTRHGRSRM